MKFSPCAALAALLLSGCVSAHVDYGLGGVRPLPRARYAAATVDVARFRDLRYADRRSVSCHARKKGSYNRGVAFDPSMSDYRDVFRGMAYDPDASYYIAPDSLYWVPDGPLTDMRARLAEHLAKAGVFRHAYADGTRGDYTLTLEVRRLLALKARHPVADGIGFLGISALFSSDEISTAFVDWTLADAKTGAVVQSGRVDFRDLARHNSFRAKDRPFRLINGAARRIGDEMAAALAH